MYMKFGTLIGAAVLSLALVGTAQAATLTLTLNEPPGAR
jgi:hypothetical protein